MVDLRRLLTSVARAESHTVRLDFAWWARRLASVAPDTSAEQARRTFHHFSADPRWQHAPEGLARAEIVRLLRDLEPVPRYAVIIAWGAGKRALWADRLRDQLNETGDDVTAKIELLLDANRRHDGSAGRITAADAFPKLWQHPDTARPLLKGLGTAFGTKVLYWAARVQGCLPPAPLIYDARVHRALDGLQLRVEVGDGSDSFFDHPWACVRFDVYTAYCSWAEQAAADLNQELKPAVAVTADDIELWLFRAAGDLSEVKVKRSGCGTRSSGGGRALMDAGEDGDDGDPDGPYLQLVKELVRLNSVARPRSTR